MAKNTHLPKIHRAYHYSSLKIFGLSIAVGLVMTIPFWRYQLGWLVFVVLLPFIYMLEVLNRTDLTKRSKVGFIWLSGWVFLLGVTFWLIQTEPGRWTGLTGWLSMSSLVLTNILFSGFLSLGFVFFGITWLYLKPEFWQKRIFLVLPALWVLAEWVRSWLFSVISLGPNTTIGPHWNFGDLGFAASVTPLVFLARFMGLYGLGFAIIMINLCVWWLVQRRYKLPGVILASIMVVSFLGYIVYQKPDGIPVRVGALQLGTNQDLKIGSIDYHASLKGIAPAKSLDIIVLPEYSAIFEQGNLQKDSDALSEVAANTMTPVITSTQRSVGNKNFNTVTIYKPGGENMYQHNKQFLVPIGEAMPYAYIYLFKLIGQGKIVDPSSQVREVSKGDTSAAPFSVNSIKLGLQACSGAISPELYRDLVKSGADILTNSASLSIFANAQSYHNQAQQMARFMAVANARPFVQATDGSYSFVLDSNGNWIVKSRQDKMQLVTATIITNNQRTLYTLLGEWIVLVSLVIAIAQGIALWRTKPSLSPVKHKRYNKK